jgi:hypothetical protein
MSNAEDIFGFGSWRSGHDPVTGFFLAMRDAWMTGAGLKESRSGQSMPSGNPRTAPPVATLLRPAGGREPAAVDLLLPMGEAMMIAANRSVSYWLGLAQIFESHQATLVQAIGVKAIDGHVAGSERLATADMMRAVLREMGDLATREARLLQSELSALDESLVQTFQQPEPSGSYRRRWRAKV